MNTLQLNENFSLGVEPDNRKLRIVVFSNDEEYVCRKTTLGELTRFFNSGAEQLFKGRLQLVKNNDNILVKVKGNIEGAVVEKQLSNLFMDINISQSR